MAMNRQELHGEPRISTQNSRGWLKYTFIREFLSELFLRLLPLNSWEITVSSLQVIIPSAHFDMGGQQGNSGKSPLFSRDVTTNF